MAFQDHHHHLSQEMPLHYPDHHHHPAASASLFRSILPDHHHSPDDKPQQPHQPAVPATNTWLHHPHHWLTTQSQPSPPTPPDNNDHHQESGGGDNSNNSNGNNTNWEREKCKADILSHPLYEQLLSAHVACLRIATPVDQLPRIDAQLARSQQVVAKYSVLGHGHPLDDRDLDHFMPLVSTKKGC